MGIKRVTVPPRAPCASLPICPFCEIGHALCIPPLHPHAGAVAAVVRRMKGENGTPQHAELMVIRPGAAPRRTRQAERTPGYGRCEASESGGTICGESFGNLLRKRTILVSMHRIGEIAKSHVVERCLRGGWRPPKRTMTLSGAAGVRIRGVQTRLRKEAGGQVCGGGDHA